MEKILPNDLIEKLKDKNPYIALQTLCEKFLEYYREIFSNTKNHTIELYNEAISAYTFIHAFATNWKLSPKQFVSTNRRDNNLATLKDLVFVIFGDAEKKYTDLMIEKSAEKYNSMFGNIYSYKIPEKDFQKIQSLVNELRDQINQSKEIKDEHKKRLIERLNKFQSELDKDMPNFDRFWGVAVEISGYLGQIGEKSKPFFVIIREIAGIISSIMNLASGQIFLGPPSTTAMIEPKK